jgi:AbrB family looped-hinge helix DNA binding protein
MKPHEHGHKLFHGTTTLGEKGQVVIPMEARKAMGLKTGDKLLVFSMGKNMVALSKFEQLEAMAKKMSQRLEGLRKILKNA